MCVTYVTVLDALAADVHAQAVGRSVAIALGQPPATEAVTWEKVRAAFDEALMAPPDGAGQDDSPDAVMLRALGLR